MKVGIALVFVVGTIVVHSFFLGFNDDPNNGNGVIPDGDGGAIFAEMIRHAEWCMAQIPEGVFVVKKTHIEKALKDLSGTVNNIPNRNVRPRSKDTSDPDYMFSFYSVDEKNGCKRGILGFWQITHDNIYLQKADELPIWLMYFRGGGGGHAECMSFVKKTEPALFSFDNAVEALDVPRIDLKIAVLESLAQECFAHKRKESLLKMEAYLASDNQRLKEWAAQMILQIAPSHVGAKGVLEKKKL